MFKKDIYKYVDDNGRVVISPYRPSCEYEHMYRLIAQSEDYMVTNYVIFAQCVDIREKDLELWVEVHKDDLETPVSQNDEVKHMIEELNKIGKLVANQVVDDIVALDLKEFYDEWVDGVTYKQGQYVMYNKILYKTLIEHVSQNEWTPDISFSLFTPVLTDPSGEEIYDWVQPDSTNAYMTGDKVRFEGDIYESLIDNNVWSPAVYPSGWKKIN